MTLELSPLTMLILGGVDRWSTWKGCEDITRITSDNVDSGGVNSQLGKDPR